MELNKDRELLGQILLKTGKLYDNELQHALKIQERHSKPIGQILKKEFSVPDKYITESLEFQKRQQESGIFLLKDRLGQLLKKLDIIDDSHIDDALDIQNSNKKLFGKSWLKKKLSVMNFWKILSEPPKEALNL